MGLESDSAHHLTNACVFPSTTAREGMYSQLLQLLIQLTRIFFVFHSFWVSRQICLPDISRLLIWLLRYR